MPYLIALLITLLVGIIVWFLGLLLGWGNITFTWAQQEYIIPTSALAAFLIFSLYPVYFILNILIRFIRLPQFIQKRWQKYQYDQGMTALTTGLIAVAAEDRVSVKKCLHKAEKHLEKNDLLDLLRYYTVTLDQDQLAQEQLSTKMLDNPRLKFLGLKGLLTQSIQKHDTAKALHLARQAYEEKPTTWLVQTIITLLAQQNAWEEAREFLTRALKKKQIAKDIAQRWLAVLDYEIALKIQSFDPRHALKLLKTSCLYDPHLVVFWQERCKLYHQHYQKPKKTIKRLQEAWEHCPHPLLIDLANQLLAFKTPFDRLKALHTIIKNRPDHPESLLALANASLQAKLWSDAENYLKQLNQKILSPRLYLLWADFATHAPQKLSAEDANYWLKKAATCALREGWFCGTCDTDHDHWQPICRLCEAFATIAWEQKSLPWPQLKGDTPAVLLATT